MPSGVCLKYCTAYPVAYQHRNIRDIALSLSGSGSEMVVARKRTLNPSKESNIPVINHHLKLCYNRVAMQSVADKPTTMIRLVLLLVVGAVIVTAQRRLALPDPRSCANRVRHATYRDARGVAHAYFFSWEHGATRNLEVDWLDSRNICRRHCMDAVSLETPQENEFVKQRISRGNVRYIWTSGRKCNFQGCDRPDLQPSNVNGWFWSGSGSKIGPTSQRNSGDWSGTGGFGQAQPDNREAPQKRGSDKGDTATSIKYAIAAKRKALNWRAVFSSHRVYLWEFQRRPCYCIAGNSGRVLETSGRLFTLNLNSLRGVRRAFTAAHGRAFLSSALRANFGRVPNSKREEGIGEGMGHSLCQGPTPAFSWSDFGKPWITEIRMPERAVSQLPQWRTHPPPSARNRCVASHVSKLIIPSVRSRHGRTGFDSLSVPLPGFRMWESRVPDDAAGRSLRCCSVITSLHPRWFSKPTYLETENVGVSGSALNTLPDPPRAFTVTHYIRTDWWRGEGRNVCSRQTSGHVCLLYREWPISAVSQTSGGASLPLLPKTEDRMFVERCICCRAVMLPLNYRPVHAGARVPRRLPITGNDESCLAILNNFYNDGVKWHDVACHHVKPFVCEDSDELLNFVRSRNPSIRL
ncbi:hypothetical protein PR048_023908 [Dryococelus australis]|uniref:C-type lectin domain-containing protein n=1 Tax=Dryococelus australis TaxID=614101 RepID=A0ABQ9GVE0_9NEOP|nr:hypothetical protein PR048_023908 [Dryococelus australis]